MKKFAILGIAALAMALPAAAETRGHSKQSKKPLIDLSATVKGLLNVDADILSTSRKGTSVLDLNATIGGLKAGVDLDISKKKGIDLDIGLGLGKSKAGKGHNYDFGGGVGH